MKYKNIFLLTISLLLSLPSSAQELTVKDMKVTNDLSASQHRRADRNGEPCALVKVRLATDGATFEGNVIPPVEYKTGEYWVYMTKGSRELHVKLPSYLPLEIHFGDYGLNQGIQSLTTYTLTLALPQASGSVQTQKLIIDYTPKDAMVLVDSKPYQENGHIELSLPLGSHDYVIAKKGYTTIEGVAKLNKDNPRTITESLKPENKQSRENKQAPTVSKPASQTESSVVNPSNKEVITVEGVSFNMIRVEGGTFTMGATSEQGSDAYDNEKPTHQVTLSTYSIGETEVTQELWKAVMGSNPSLFKGKKHPVELVSWNSCQEFIRKLNAKTGRQFRLPTEAEWEYAARGGKNSLEYKYSGSNTIDDVAWYTITTKDKGTRDVKTKKANELDLYDMSGNVWEWCQDKIGNSSRVIRGGGWDSSARGCRVPSRGDRMPDNVMMSLGFRLAL